MKRIHGHHATLADVARRAGVGKATVSRVINGAGKVSPDTLKRINTVIRELGYRPSQAARSLKGEGTKAIGLVLPSIADPFFAGCAEAAQEIARSHGYLTIVAATNYDGQTEISQLESLIRHRVEAILLAPANGKAQLLASMVDSLNIPVVSLNHPLASSSAPSVLCNNRGGARVATKHLLGHGYQRVLCLGGDSRLYTIRERQKGYADAIRAAGLDVVIEGDVNNYEQVEALLRAQCFPTRKIDAIFAVRNSITIFAFQAMQCLGLRIPDQVALIGFDDFELACTLRPAVTVIQQPIQEMGGYAAKLLFRHLIGPKLSDKPEAARSPFETTLVLRNSCGCS